MKLLILLFVLFVAGMAFSSFPGDEDYTVAADEFPAPIGGMAAIVKNIVYPAMAMQTHIEGKVYVLAYINEKGSVDDAKLVKGIGAGCDEAAITAIKKTKFTPGKMKGVNVKTKLTLPITFKMK
jgi:protein TonB